MKERKLAVIGAALDLGSGRRGVDMGPSAIRYAGLNDRLARLGFECEDVGNVRTATPEATASGDPQARFLPQIKETCAGIAAKVSAALQDAHVPIVLGGDHSIALGTLAEHDGGVALTVDVARWEEGRVQDIDGHAVFAGDIGEAIQLVDGGIEAAVGDLCGGDDVLDPPTAEGLEALLGVARLACVRARAAWAFAARRRSTGTATGCSSAA